MFKTFEFEIDNTKELNQQDDETLEAINNFLTEQR